MKMKTVSYRKLNFILFLIFVYILLNIGSWMFYISAKDSLDISLSKNMKIVLMTLKESLYKKNRKIINVLEKLAKTGAVEEMILLDKKNDVIFDSNEKLKKGREYPYLPLIKPIVDFPEKEIYISQSYETNGNIYKMGVLRLENNLVVMVTPTYIKNELERMKRILFIVSGISFIGILILGIVMDIFFKKMINIQKDLLIKERLASLGSLSAGVAHEIRNPLGIIQGTCEVLKKREHFSEQEKNLLGYIEEETMRIENTVRNFLKISSESAVENRKVDIDLNEDIEKIYLKEEHLFKEKNIKVELNLDSNIPKIQMTKEESVSLIINLFHNAAEALEKCENKIIRVETKNIGNDIVFAIEDSGKGISEEIKEKIFDQFFTTKESGTGIGLSVVKGITESINGDISVENSELGGTRVEIVIKK